MSAARSAVEAVDLTVSYGSARGIAGVNLDVPMGEVTGLLGPNGAGKSTLLRAALDLVHPTAGEIKILGISSRERRARTDVAYLPGDLLLPGQLTGWSVMRRFTAARGPLDESRIRSLAQRLDLDLNRRVGQLSKGNRQKIGLLLAFAPQARVLLLDEPTSGLDPLLQREFGDMVGEAIDDGVTVLLSSHVLSELEGLASRVAVLRSGELVTVESTAHLRGRARQLLRLEMTTPDDAESLAHDLQHVGRIERDGSIVHVTYTGHVDPIVKAAARYSTKSIDKIGGDLDDVLLDFYSDESQP